LCTCGLRSISKSYAYQEQSGLDKLCHLANQLHTFILAKLHHMLFALYFYAIALHHVPSDDSASTFTGGSFDDVYIRVAEDSGVNESTPLLRAVYSSNTSSSSTSQASSLRKDCLNWRSVGLLAMCASALALATYLLWRQTQLPDFGYRLSLIEHDIWSDMDLQGRGTLLDPLKVVTVFFTHTASEGCHEDCPEMLHKLQRSHQEELPYNFLITGDCQAFEARGWGYESSFSKGIPLSSSLVIAFVGNFQRIPPSNCQLNVAQALLLESLKRRRLQPDYQLFVVGNDAEAVQQELKFWPRYSGHRRVK
ncbi:hypothetical protein KR009_008088, partial [Drosophila setifemur]